LSAEQQATRIARMTNFSLFITEPLGSQAAHPLLTIAAYVMDDAQIDTSGRKGRIVGVLLVRDLNDAIDGSTVHNVSQGHGPSLGPSLKRGFPERILGAPHRQQRGDLTQPSTRGRDYPSA
jgi:hypothetical protein